MPLYYEDIEVGQKWTTAARTISEHDLLTFAGLTGDMHPLHTDEESARASRFGGRIAHGFLVAAIASGLGYRLLLTEGTIVANLGTSWRFFNPVKIGDTIHVVIEITSKRDSAKNPDAGVVARSYEVKNQRGETCARGEVVVMFKKKAAAGRAADE